LSVGKIPNGVNSNYTAIIAKLIGIEAANYFDDLDFLLPALLFRFPGAFVMLSLSETERALAHRFVRQGKANARTLTRTWIATRNWLMAGTKARLLRRLR